jgi:hypothetical protein
LAQTKTKYRQTKQRRYQQSPCTKGVPHVHGTKKKSWLYLVTLIAMRATLVHVVNFALQQRRSKKITFVASWAFKIEYAIQGGIFVQHLFLFLCLNY